MSQDELMHYGVKGMKWRYHKARPETYSSKPRSKSQQMKYQAKQQYRQAKQQYRAERKSEMSTPEAKAKRAQRAKTAVKVGAAVAASMLAVYGGHKLNQYVKTKNGQIAAERGYNYAKKMFEGMSKMDMGNSKRMSISVDAGKHAKNYARNASNDNFRTAARNVINYKKSGGNLKSLRNVNEYGNGISDVFELMRERK